MYWSQKEENVMPWDLPKIKIKKTKNTELKKVYLMQSNFLFTREYKNKMKPTDKITYVAGTCFERNAKPKNTGINAQYNFLWLFIANNKL